MSAAKKKQPENIEWIVRGRVTYSGVTCIVHAPNREEAIRRAEMRDTIGELDVSCAEVVDWSFGAAEPNVDNED